MYTKIKEEIALIKGEISVLKEQHIGCELKVKGLEKIIKEMYKYHAAKTKD